MERIMSTIKNYIWIVLVLGLAGIPLMAQKASPSKAAKLAAVDRPAAVETHAKTKEATKAAPGLSPSQRAAAVDTSLLNTCKRKAPEVPRVLAHDAQVFSADRIGKTLKGVWRGRVSGDYDNKLLTDDGFLNVDYYMIIDVKRGEALVFEQFGDSPAIPEPKPGAPVWSFVTCGENYTPRFPAQVHEFVKVSDNVEDARELLGVSTGLILAERGELVLSDVWQELVATKYFDDPKRSLAYAGAFFNPFKIENVPSQSGFLLEMIMQAEYRGSGQTAARFELGEPIHGVEKGQFLGVETDSGDFLVASVSFGRTVIVSKAAQGPTGFIDSPYDKVVIGPLAPSDNASLRDSSRNHRSRNHSSRSDKPRK